MGYDRGDSFPFDFEPNRIPFGSKSKGNCHHDHIALNVKGNGNIVLSVCRIDFPFRYLIRAECEAPIAKLE